MEGIRLLEPNATLEELFSSGAYSDSYGESASYGLDAPLQIDASAQLGSIYIYDTERAAASVLPSNTSSFGSGDSIERRVVPPQLSDELAFDLEPIITNAVEFDDTLDKVTLSTFMPNSLWLASSSRTNLRFEPGVLSVLSGTLLVPPVITHRGRLYPGFCPYRPTPLQSERGQVSELIKGSIAGFNTSRYVLGHRTTDGLAEYSLKLIAKGRKNAVAFFRTNITYTAALLTAIGLSVGLSLFLGLAFTYALIETLRRALIKFQFECEKNKRLAGFIKEVKTENDSMQVFHLL